ncbi:MAG TPA: porin, partial [Burkholderiales bacterium]|nr:porin [Burkholderiales bacterium]
MSSLRSGTLASVAIIVLSLSSQAAHAQAAPSPEEQALRQRVEDLERQLKQLEERFNQQAKPETPAAAAQPTQPVGGPSAQEQATQTQIDQLNQQVKALEQKEQSLESATEKKTVLPVTPGARPGLVLTSPSSPFQLRFGAVVQVDYRQFFDPPSPVPQSSVDTFLLRRIRPIFEGGYEDFGFKIMPDFGNGSNTTPAGNSSNTTPTPQIFDAWVYWNPYTEFNTRVGKMKAPLGLEELQEDVNIAFPERAFPSQLIPNRDIGLQASGALFNRTVSYAAGVFNGAVDNNSANDGSGDFNNGKDVNARVFAQPWKNTDLKALRGLGFGVGYGFGIQSASLANPALPNYVTPGQQTWFAYNNGTFANGRRESWTPQIYYSVGPVGLLGEWTNTAQVFTRGANTQTVSNTAWQVQLAWVLTGEDASYLGVTPSQNFSLKGGHWGSLTLVGRVSQLKIDSDAFVGTAATQLANPNTQPGKATDYGIGLSWDLSREVRIYFTYDQTKFDGGAPNGNNRPDEKVL